MLNRKKEKVKVYNPKMIFILPFCGTNRDNIITIHQSRPSRATELQPSFLRTGDQLHLENAHLHPWNARLDGCDSLIKFLLSLSFIPSFLSITVPSRRSSSTRRFLFICTCCAFQADRFWILSSMSKKGAQIAAHQPNRLAFFCSELGRTTKKNRTKGLRGLSAVAQTHMANRCGVKDQLQSLTHRGALIAACEPGR